MLKPLVNILFGSSNNWKQPAALRKTGAKVKFTYLWCFPLAFAWFAISLNYSAVLLTQYAFLTWISLIVVFCMFDQFWQWLRAPAWGSKWYRFHFFDPSTWIDNLWFSAFFSGLAIVVTALITGTNFLPYIFDTPPLIPYIGAFVSTFIIPQFIMRIPPMLIELMEIIKTSDWYREYFVIGRGGSARWASLREYCALGFEFFIDQNQRQISERSIASPIYLGKSLWYLDPQWPMRFSFFTNRFRVFSGRSWGGRDIGLSTENHMITVAPNGSGKSRDVLHNNLLTYTGGCFILDPKGEHVQRTYERRQARHVSFSDEERDYKLKEIKQCISSGDKASAEYLQNKLTQEGLYNCHVLDPFGLVSDIVETDYWNPLAEIDPNSLEALEDVKEIAENLIEPDPKDKHFRESSVAILAGVIAHVITWPFFKDEQRNLSTVRNLLVIGTPDNVRFDEFTGADVFNQMHENQEALIDVIQSALQFLKRVGERERGGFYSTIYRSISWLNSKPLQENTNKSTFSLADIKRKYASVYVVIPTRNYSLARRWQKILASMSIRVLQRTPLMVMPNGKRHRALMVFDEFAKLGYFPPIADHFATMRGYDIKLWVFLQTFSQLDVYENKAVFLGNSDIQVFGIDNDMDDLRYISDKLGQYRLVRRTGEDKGGNNYEEHTRVLMTTEDISATLSKNSWKQIVMPLGMPPLLLERIPFYDNFSNTEYGRVKDLGDMPQEPPEEKTKPKPRYKKVNGEWKSA